MNDRKNTLAFKRMTDMQVFMYFVNTNKFEAKVGCAEKKTILDHLSLKLQKNH